VFSSDVQISVLDPTSEVMQLLLAQMKHRFLEKPSYITVMPDSRLRAAAIK